MLPSFPELKSSVEKLPGVAALLPLVSGSASISVNEEIAGFTLLWGTDFSAYRTMFPDSLEIIEGAYPVDEGSHILLSQTVREAVEKELGAKIALGDTITLGSFGAGGNRLRTAKISGFFRFKRGNAQLDRISLVSTGTLRALKDMTSKPVPKSVEPGNGSRMASAGDGISDADLFGNPRALVLKQAPESKGTGKLNFDHILGDTSVRNQYSEVDVDAWNFLLVRLSPSTSIPRVQKAIQGTISRLGLDAAVSDWSWGAGAVATLAVSLQLIFNIIIFIILVVAVIIIMNTLVISVTERIGEIGTIRAIGDGKSFIRRMIIWETLTLSLTAGLGGVLLGAILIGVIKTLGIESSNVFF